MGSIAPVKMDGIQLRSPTGMNALSMPEINMTTVKETQDKDQV